MEEDDDDDEEDDDDDDDDDEEGEREREREHELIDGTLYHARRYRHEPRLTLGELRKGIPAPN